MDIIDVLRARLTALLDERAAAQAEMDTILDSVGAEERSEFNDEETTRFGGARDTVVATDTKIDETRQRLTQIEETRSASAKADQLRASLGARPDDKAPVPAGGAKVTDPEIYHKRSSESFFADAYAAQYLTDFDARDRLTRHQRAVREAWEKRDVAVSAFGGLIVPLYLTEDFAEVARAGRPFANTVRSLPLPSTGVAAVIPRGTTGTLAAATAEAAAWSEQDYAVTDLNLTVNLITAQQDMSRTVFMRGNGVDQLLFGDMQAAYAVALDSAVINGNGTAPNHRGILNVTGINSVTYTDATPTVGELWSKLADAVQRVNTNRFMPASVIVMHPSRWGWLTASLDTTNRPLIETTADIATNPVAVGLAAEYGQVVGKMLGLPVVTDANIPANLGAGVNEDRIIIMRAFDHVLWEEPGGPMQFTFEQTLGPEKVRIALGAFSMFTAGRYPTATSVVSGTGLVTPTF